MIAIRYLAVFVLLLTALLSVIKQMAIALDEENLENFTIWTSVACVIAGLPMMLW